MVELNENNIKSQNQYMKDLSNKQSIFPKFNYHERVKKYLNIIFIFYKRIIESEGLVHCPRKHFRFKTIYN